MNSRQYSKFFAILVALALVATLLGSAAFPTRVRAASLTVNSLLDTVAVDGNCTLREAIQNANADALTNADCVVAGSGADTITFSVSGTITLGSSLPDITDAAGLTMDGTGQTVTISGDNLYRVLRVNTSLTLNHLTIANGNSIGTAGGILNSGTLLTITNSTFLNNKASGNSGGGIWNSEISTLTISNSTFSGNSAIAWNHGGGIFNYGGTATITNSTFSGNSAEGKGGGILNSNSGTLTVRNSTFSGNSAATGGGISNIGGSTVTLYNTIMANSTAGGNCDGTISDGGYNLDSINTCGFTSNAKINADPELGALTGSPAYFPLSAGSPAINMGNNSICAASPVNNHSQNGVTRPQGARCDIGAYEAILPKIVSSLRTNPNPTNTASVHFSVTFSKAVTGVDKTDFNLTVSGITGALVTGVSGSGATYTVTVNTSMGNGTLRLNVRVGATITDLAGYSLANLPFTSGQVYTVNKSLTFYSAGTYDGWVLESSEALSPADTNTSSIGGMLNSTATTLRLGDDAARKQYRSILSFSTGASLPDTAVITAVILRIKMGAVTGGGNPVTMFQGFMVDLKKGFFGTSAALQTSDFQIPASMSYGPFNSVLVSGWYTINLTSGKAYINKLATGSGLTQIRLRFKLDDNNNTVANYLSLYSGNALVVTDRPLLIIAYYVP